MAKTNKEIQQDYAARNPLAKLGIAADDLVRIAASGLTGGLVDRALGGDNAERTREARVRAGLAGDVSNVAGMVLGLKGVGAGASAARSVARSAPIALSAARSAGPAMGLRVLTNTAGPGLVPVAANAVSKGALAKGAGLLGLLGLSIAGRQDPEAPAIAPSGQPAAEISPAKAVAQSMASGHLAKDRITPRDRALAAIDTILRGPFTIDEFQAATGALPNTAGEKTPLNKDMALGAAAAATDKLFEQAIADAQKLPDQQQRDKAVLDATMSYRDWLARIGGTKVEDPLPISLEGG